MPISPRNAEFRSFAASGLGPSNPSSGGITSPGEIGGTSYSNKQNTAQMGGKTLSGAQTNISTFGKMPTLPAIKPGDFPAKKPKLPTNPSMGSKGAGMRMGAFNLGSNGMGMRIE